MLAYFDEGCFIIAEDRFAVADPIRATPFKPMKFFASIEVESHFYGSIAPGADGSSKILMVGVAARNAAVMRYNR